MTKLPPVALLAGQAPPRVLHAPSNPRRSSWEDVADLSARFGVVLDEWQEAVLRAAMSERTDGRWATPQVAISAPRQQGKSQLIVARALAGILLFDEQTIIISAHQQDTAREVFTRLVDILEDHAALNARVETYGKALNREYIRFTSGQVIRFKARSTGGGRGFSCDCLLLDEAQILAPSAWAAILPTMSARPNPQVWLLGTPPTAQDDGEVFGRFRDAGLSGKESRLAYLEWSADEDDDINDPMTWAKANPAFGYRISHDAVAGERATMSDDQFSMERLGMWAGSISKNVIDAESWARISDPASLAIENLSLAIDVAPDRSVAAVSFAGQRADGIWHVELDEHRNGVGWVVPWVVARCERNEIRAVVVDGGRSPASSLIDAFEKAGIKVTQTTAGDMATACARFYDGAMEQSFRHTDQPQVNVSLSTASKRPIGDAWGWNRKGEASDITPIVSATLALWGAQNGSVKKPTRKNRNSERRAVVM